jgi:hypothetical protein
VIETSGCKTHHRIKGHGRSSQLPGLGSFQEQVHSIGFLVYRLGEGRYLQVRLHARGARHHPADAYHLIDVCRVELAHVLGRHQVVSAHLQAFLLDVIVVAAARTQHGGRLLLHDKVEDGDHLLRVLHQLVVQLGVKGVQVVAV